MVSYYGEEGCCLTCEEGFEGCLCYECKCSKCYYYDKNDEGYGYCRYKYENAHVRISIVDNEVIVEINPSFKEEIFKMIISLLKEHFFKYEPEQKIWIRKIGNPKSIPYLIKLLEELDVNVIYSSKLFKKLGLEHNETMGYLQICSYCNAQFFTKADLELHLKTHEGLIGVEYG